MMNKLYAVTGHSESGDDYFIGVFDEYPADDRLLALIERDYSEEIVDGYSYISCSIHEVDGVSKLPDPTNSGVEFL